MRAVRLRTEYLTNPMGIDIVTPRLSWNCQDGKRQDAYEIEAYDEAGNTVWNSGIVESSKMHLIEWGGPKLTSRQRICWKVRLRENDGWGPWSEMASFEIGLLQKEDWSAKWITGDCRPNKKTQYPVDCFRKCVSRQALSHEPVSGEDKGTGKSVRKARLYATACGLYEILINGERAGDFQMAPGYTDYNKRIQYQTIDVTELVQRAYDTPQKSPAPESLGNLVITAQLASGWYRGSVGAHGLRFQYGKETKLFAQLEIEYEDGSKDTIVTDESWEWSNDGPIRYADNKDGEWVDENCSPSYSGRARVTDFAVTPTASDNVPVIDHEQFRGKRSISPSGRIIYDFGQNIAGHLSFTLTAKKGQVLKLRFGEMIGKDGELTQKNIQCISKKKITPLQEVLYVCKDGRNHYRTKFAVFGFQYVEVETEDYHFEEQDYYSRFLDETDQKYRTGQTRDKAAASAPVDLTDAEFTAIAVYSDIEEIGSFESSNPLLNQFVEATKWSTKGNSLDIPTDCPTRERHGWTGDAQIFFESASYLFDYAAFSQKYLRDVYDWQKASGRLPQIAPYGGVDFYMAVMNGSVGWADIGVLLPYRFYRINGDLSILTDYYDRMKLYAKFMQSRCGKWGGVYAKPTGVKGPCKKYLVNAGQSYDEWAEPQDVKMFVWTDFAAPHPEVSTAYTAYIMSVMVEIAKLTGHEEDIANYKEYQEGCTKAYQELIRQKDFSIDTDRQARLVRPLAFGLLDEKDREFAKKRLLKALDNYGYRLGTGFLSTPLILDVLKEIDPDAAYRLLENEEIPGWLSMPKAGATTIWEAWEGANAEGEVASLNHYSKGALCEWLFREMCGIHVDGENHFTIHPHPGGHFTFAKATYKSVYGTVVSGWTQKEDGSYEFTVELPPNTSADYIY